METRERAETMNVKYSGMMPALLFGTVSPLHAENLPAFNLTIKNGRYSPEQVEIPASQKIKLVIKNDGPGPEEFESSDLNREKLIFVGEFYPKTAQGRI